jgi:hypothetical protein
MAHRNGDGKGVPSSCNFFDTSNGEDERDVGSLISDRASGRELIICGDGNASDDEELD